MDIDYVKNHPTFPGPVVRKSTVHRPRTADLLAQSKVSAIGVDEIAQVKTSRGSNANGSAVVASSVVIASDVSGSRQGIVYSQEKLQHRDESKLVNSRSGDVASPTTSTAAASKVFKGKILQLWLLMFNE